jgi:hypothetical protein
MLIAVAIYIAAEFIAPHAASTKRVADADQTTVAIIMSVATLIVVIHQDGPPYEIWGTLILLAFLHAVQLGRHVLRILAARRWRASADWKNLRVATPVPRRGVSIAGPTLLPIPAWIAATVCSGLNAPNYVYVIVAIASVVWAVVTLVPVSRILLFNLRLPAEGVRAAALVAALRDVEPEILVHFNARVTSAYAINDWVTTLERLNEKHRVVILIVDRQPWHLQTIATSRLPIVYIQGAEAIEHLVEQVPSITMALYPRNTAANKNILRVPNLYDVYINHGESDKAEAANPATRAFDEVWVVGEAARERYLTANIGVRSDQLRIVGRPQLSELLATAPLVEHDEVTTVVYAPTWEGYFAADGYSSLPTMGEAVVAAMLARPATRVVYAPHPPVGTLSGVFAAANEAILRQLRRAGTDRAIVAREFQRDAALAAADVLVTDIGSELTDFLALDRPYLVLHPGASSVAEFAGANPSAGGGVVVEPTAVASIANAITDAVTNDPKRAERAVVRAHYLGELDTPPIERFLGQVESALELVQKTRPRPIDTVVTESASL